MSVMNRERGFTIVEVVTTLAIMGLLLAFLYQTFFVGQSQQLKTVRLAAANDLAQTNLRKITDKTQILAKTGTAQINGKDAAQCNSTNDLTSGSASATGTELDFTPEAIPSSLPSDTEQHLYVKYPQGCTDSTLPAQILSIVKYASGTEMITRTSYVTTAQTL